MKQTNVWQSTNEYFIVAVIETGPIENVGREYSFRMETRSIVVHNWLTKETSVQVMAKEKMPLTDEDAIAMQAAFERFHNI